MASYKEQDSTKSFEKRKLPRFPVQLPVELGNDGGDLSSICTNLSSDGVSVETALPMGVGERLAVKIVLTPQEEPLRMMGQVVWKRNLNALCPDSQPIVEVGIRFLRPLPSPWKQQEVCWG